MLLETAWRVGASPNLGEGLKELRGLQGSPRSRPVGLPTHLSLGALDGDLPSPGPQTGRLLVPEAQTRVL